MHDRYANADPAHRPHGARAVLRWAVTDRLLGRRRRRPPGPPAPQVAPDLELVRERSPLPRLTWIGHASFLGSLGGDSFLIDPVLSARVGGLFRRCGRPGLEPEELPDLAAVLVTHSHYDHLDAPSLDLVPVEVPVVVPAGLGSWMKHRGRRRVAELEWWQSEMLGGLEVTLVPARHWSKRGVADTNRSWWGGYVVRGDGVAVYHAGDTARFDGFTEIGRRTGPLAVAMLPVGGYDPAWFMEQQHLNPEQAGEAFLELGAEIMVPMHWGAFRLTDEPLCEPRDRIEEWWRRRGGAAGASLRVLAVGESLVLDRPPTARIPEPTRAIPGRTTVADAL
jgi:L-ascorbate metabolism protein UlaG (beta-lactamase superfamily)